MPEYQQITFQDIILPAPSSATYSYKIFQTEHSGQQNKYTGELYYDPITHKRTVGLSWNNIDSTKAALFNSIDITEFGLLEFNDLFNDNSMECKASEISSSYTILGGKIRWTISMTFEEK